MRDSRHDIRGDYSLTLRSLLPDRVRAVDRPWETPATGTRHRMWDAGLERRWNSHLRKVSYPAARRMAESD